MANVLVACEYSGIVRDAFAAIGHRAVSCDLLPSEAPGEHYRGDIRDILHADKWDLIIAHPECRYLTNAGVSFMSSGRRAGPAYLTGIDRWKACYEACQFFRLFLHHPCRLVCVENPIPHKYALGWIGQKYAQTIQPWQFGHGETKRTCLWLKGLPLLTPTNIVDGRETRVWSMSPGRNRSKDRSRFYSGIAAAMAAQWGPLLLRV